VSQNTTEPRKGFFAKIAAKNAGAIWGPRAKLIAKLPPSVLSRLSRLVDANDFALAVVNTPEDQLQATLQGPMRGFILNEVVGRMEAEFIAGRGEDLDAVIQITFIDTPGGGAPEIFQIKITHGTCKSGAGQLFTKDAESKIETDALSFIKLSSGIETGVDLYLGGKIKFDGGMMMLTRLTRMFNIPNVAKKPPAPTPGRPVAA
jgi:hypothetical protein